ncbi:nucleolar MIF4G domain-containing protein 1 [Talpa occidentalis]|uniref:nucleolar MIF4G domain-containing protein 1 n=1 Tax=Talpa occidentalis TaxID=50954 RepID=UPI00188F7CE9|nr:nucleolar MIF4G domain-containing protein 1 [Talpa occidentalis]
MELCPAERRRRRLREAYQGPAVATCVTLRAAREARTPGGGAGAGARAGGRGPGGRRGRRELRREKRRLRRARRRPHPAGPEPAGPEPGPGAAAARRRALLAANEEEDREIRRLERCLGLRARARGGPGDAVPPGFARDGLGYVLGALGAVRGAGLGAGSGEDEDEDEDEGAGPTPPDSDLDSGSERGAAGTSEEPSEEEEEPEPRPREPGTPRAAASAAGAGAERRGPRRVRFAEDGGGGAADAHATAQVAATQGLCEHGETCTLAPVRQVGGAADTEKEKELERLRRRVKGLINRLSEPNMASISGQLEELYMAHSRKDMSDTLTAALLSACAPDTAMPGRLVMEHVLLLSVLHHTVGVEVGAHFLEAVVRRFDAIYAGGGPGKECENLLAIVAHLYNFRVVQARLVFDVLRKLAATFTEKDVELILAMLRNVGFSLRKDDAVSLKELIAEAQAKASGAGSQFQDQTRVRFMLETMLALKNNDMRKIPGYDPEPVERLRKLQRALVRGIGSGADSQLRVSWDDVLNAQQTGRWWIVGSAWSGAPMIDNSQQARPRQPAGTVSAKILELARKQRMNTDVRRNIFCTIVTSEDFLDAFEKLLKLGLKDQQEREIVHVLVDCCLQEKTYNPFYAFLAGKLCEYERRFQMTFQFSIWDRLRDLESLPATNCSNLVHLLAHLLKTKALPLSVLKVVEFSELDKPRVHFLRKVLHKLLVETDVEDLALVFARVSDNPKLGVFREGLKLFVSHFLLRSARHRSAEDASLLRERAELAARSLQGKASLRL